MNDAELLLFASASMPLLAWLTYGNIKMNRRAVAKERARADNEKEHRGNENSS
jgi:hypothetical protein